MAITHHYLFNTATQYFDTVGTTHFTNNYGSIFATGKINQCYQSTYNMINTTSAATSANPLPTSGSYSIVLWFFPYSSTGASGIFNIYNSSTLLNNLRLYADPSTGTVTFYDNSSNTHTLTSSVTYNAWNHLAIIWNGTTWAYYVNGASKSASGTAPNATNAQASTCVFRLMGENSAGGFYIDDLRIYNNAITATDVGLIYNSASGTEADNPAVFYYKDRVRETTTTTSTGSVALAGAVTGFQTFSAAIGANNTCYYTISHRTAAEWEVGFGTLDATAANLARTTILASSNSGSAVNFSAGTKDVFNTIPALTPQSAFIPSSTGSAIQAVALPPYGTSTGNTAEMRFLELAANGINYVGFKAADSLSANNIWTLPSVDGSTGNLLQTNGSGTLSWAPDDYPCQGRLTLTSGTPVTTSDVTAAGTVYFTPYLGNVIGLWNTTTSKWDKFNFSELSASLAALYGGDTNIDFFVYNNAGTPALYLVTWSSNTARATALTTQNGILVASGSPQYRYVGTVRTTTTAFQTEDSHSLRLVWNQYNRVVKSLRRAEPTTSWTYGSTGSTVTRYQFNNSSNRVDVVCGESQGVFVKFFCDSSRNAAGTSFMGINYQTTNISGSPGGSTVVLNSCGSNASVLNLIQSTSCAYSIQLPVGYASFGAVEWNNATTFTTTSYGSTRSGLYGLWPC